jgi:large subunit ribosomal protein L19
MLLRGVEQSHLKKVPNLKAGQTVKVFQKIKEGEKERVQMFEGLIISVKGESGMNQNITVRKIVSGVGVEKIFPVHSSTIQKIEVVKEAKVRRAKLYYMRERSGKSARLKETYLKEEDIEYIDAPEMELATSDEVAVEETAPTEEIETPAEEVTSEEAPTTEEETKEEKA